MCFSLSRGLQQDRYANTNDPLMLEQWQKEMIPCLTGLRECSSRRASLFSGYIVMSPCN
ncbi:hypothetical protein J6590_093540, partial [Homalodisca vitripennis]